MSWPSHSDFSNRDLDAWLLMSGIGTVMCYLHEGVGDHGEAPPGDSVQLTSMNSTLREEQIQFVESYATAFALVSLLS